MANAASRMRSELVKLQLRDKNGRWIEMGKKAKWYSQSQGKMLTGTIVGSDGKFAYMIPPLSNPTHRPQPYKVPLSSLGMMPVKANLKDKNKPSGTSQAEEAYINKARSFFDKSFTAEQKKLGEKQQAAVKEGVAGKHTNDILESDGKKDKFIASRKDAKDRDETKLEAIEYDVDDILSDIEFRLSDEDDSLTDVSADIEDEDGNPLKITARRNKGAAEIVVRDADNEELDAFPVGRNSSKEIAKSVYDAYDDGAQDETLPTEGIDNDNDGIADDREVDQDTDGDGIADINDTEGDESAEPSTTKVTAKDMTDAPVGSVYAEPDADKEEGDDFWTKVDANTWEYSMEDPDVKGFPTSNSAAFDGADGAIYPNAEAAGMKSEFARPAKGEASEESTEDSAPAPEEKKAAPTPIPDNSTQPIIPGTGAGVKSKQPANIKKHTKTLDKMAPGSYVEVDAGDTDVFGKSLETQYTKSESGVWEPESADFPGLTSAELAEQFKNHDDFDYTEYKNDDYEKHTAKPKESDAVKRMRAAAEAARKDSAEPEGDDSPQDEDEAAEEGTEPSPEPTPEDETTEEAPADDSAPEPAPEDAPEEAPADKDWPTAEDIADSTNDSWVPANQIRPGGHLRLNKDGVILRTTSDKGEASKSGKVVKITDASPILGTNKTSMGKPVGTKVDFVDENGEAGTANLYSSNPRGSEYGVFELDRSKSQKAADESTETTPDTAPDDADPDELTIDEEWQNLDDEYIDAGIFVHAGAMAKVTNARRANRGIVPEEQRDNLELARQELEDQKAVKKVADETLTRLKDPKDIEFLRATTKSYGYGKHTSNVANALKKKADELYGEYSETPDYIPAGSKYNATDDSYMVKAEQFDPSSMPEGTHVAEWNDEGGYYYAYTKTGENEWFDERNNEMRTDSFVAETNGNDQEVFAPDSNGMLAVDARNVLAANIDKIRDQIKNKREGDEAYDRMFEERAREIEEDRAKKAADSDETADDAPADDEITEESPEVEEDAVATDEATEEITDEVDDEDQVAKKYNSAAEYEAAISEIEALAAEYNVPLSSLPEYDKVDALRKNGKMFPDKNNPDTDYYMEAAFNAVNDSKKWNDYVEDRAVTSDPLDAFPEIKRNLPTALEGEDYPPTQQQQDVIDAVLAGKDVKVRAMAGTGKTSTLKALAERLKVEGKNAIYVAFNSTVQKEAEERMPDNVESRTGHSLAHNWASKQMSHLITKSNGKDPQNSKYNSATRKEEPADKQFTTNLTEIARALGIKDENGMEPEETALLVRRTVESYLLSDKDLPEESNIPLKDPEDPESGDGLNQAQRDAVVKHAQAYWEDLGRADGQFRVTHDVYRKYWALSKPDLTKTTGGSKKAGAEVLFIDEAQDTPPVLAKVVADQNIQKVIVGDQNQAIYAFAETIDYLELADAEIDLPLNKSWRFGRAVADAGNRFLQLLGTSDRVIGGGKGGEVQRGSEMEDADAVLVRTNAGLVREILTESERGRTVASTEGVRDNLIRLANTVEGLQNGRPLRRPHEDLMGYKNWSDVVEASDRGDRSVSTIVGIFDETSPKKRAMAAERFGGLEQMRRDKLALVREAIDSIVEVIPEFEDVVEIKEGKRTYLTGADHLAGNKKLYAAKNLSSALGKRNDPRAADDATGFVDRMAAFHRAGFGDRSKSQWRWDKNKSMWYSETQDLAALKSEYKQEFDVVISTAHKSKGLEWDNVRIGYDFRGPDAGSESSAPYTPSDDELKLAYVAVTRAKKKLDPGSLEYVYDMTDPNGGDPESQSKKLNLTEDEKAARAAARREEQELEELLANDPEDDADETEEETAPEPEPAPEEEAEEDLKTRIRKKISEIEDEERQNSEEEQRTISEEPDSDEDIDQEIAEEEAEESPVEPEPEEEEEEEEEEVTPDPEPSPEPEPEPEPQPEPEPAPEPEPSADPEIASEYPVGGELDQAPMQYRKLGDNEWGVFFNGNDIGGRLNDSQIDELFGLSKTEREESTNEEEVAPEPEPQPEEDTTPEPQPEPEPAPEPEPEPEPVVDENEKDLTKTTPVKDGTETKEKKAKKKASIATNPNIKNVRYENGDLIKFGDTVLYDHGYTEPRVSSDRVHHEMDVVGIDTVGKVRLLPTGTMEYWTRDSKNNWTFHSEDRDQVIASRTHGNIIAIPKKMTGLDGSTIGDDSTFGTGVNVRDNNENMIRVGTYDFENTTADGDVPVLGDKVRFRHQRVGSFGTEFEGTVVGFNRQTQALQVEFFNPNTGRHETRFASYIYTVSDKSKMAVPTPQDYIDGTVPIQPGYEITNRRVRRAGSELDDNTFGDLEDDGETTTTNEVEESAEETFGDLEDAPDEQAIDEATDTLYGGLDDAQKSAWATLDSDPVGTRYTTSDGEVFEKTASGDLSNVNDASDTMQKADFIDSYWQASIGAPAYIKNGNEGDEGRTGGDSDPDPEPEPQPTEPDPVDEAPEPEDAPEEEAEVDEVEPTTVTNLDGTTSELDEAGLAALPPGTQFHDTFDPERATLWMKNEGGTWDEYNHDSVSGQYVGNVLRMGLENSFMLGGELTLIDTSTSSYYDDIIRRRLGHEPTVKEGFKRGVDWEKAEFMDDSAPAELDEDGAFSVSNPSELAATLRTLAAGTVIYSGKGYKIGTVNSEGMVSWSNTHGGSGAVKGMEASKVFTEWGTEIETDPDFIQIQEAYRSSVYNKAPGENSDFELLADVSMLRDSGYAYFIPEDGAKFKTVAPEVVYTPEMATYYKDMKARHRGAGLSSEAQLRDALAGPIGSVVTIKKAGSAPAMLEKIGHDMWASGNPYFTGSQTLANRLQYAESAERILRQWEDSKKYSVSGTTVPEDVFNEHLQNLALNGKSPTEYLASIPYDATVSVGKETFTKKSDGGWSTAQGTVDDGTMLLSMGRFGRYSLSNVDAYKLTNDLKNLFADYQPGEIVLDSKTGESYQKRDDGNWDVSHIKRYSGSANNSFASFSRVSATRTDAEILDLMMSNRIVGADGKDIHKVADRTKSVMDPDYNKVQQVDLGGKNWFKAAEDGTLPLGTKIRFTKGDGIEYEGTVVKRRDETGGESMGRRSAYAFTYRPANPKSVKDYDYNTGLFGNQPNDENLIAITQPERKFNNFENQYPKHNIARDGLKDTDLEELLDTPHTTYDLSAMDVKEMATLLREKYDINLITEGSIMNNTPTIGLQETIAGYLQMFDKYPWIASEVGNITLSDYNGSAAASAGGDNITSGKGKAKNKYLNIFDGQTRTNNQFSMLNHLKKRSTFVVPAYKTGVSPTSSHEFGHIIDFNRHGTDFADNGVGAWLAEYMGITLPELHAMGSRKALDIVAKDAYFSDYGWYNSTPKYTTKELPQLDQLESIAESISDVEVNGRNASPLSIFIWKKTLADAARRRQFVEAFGRNPTSDQELDETFPMPDIPNTNPAITGQPGRNWDAVFAEIAKMDNDGDE